MRTVKRKKGFTLLELVIYIGLSLIVLAALVSFAWVLIQDQTKQDAITEVADQGRFVLDTMTYHAQRAQSIDAATVYATNPGLLRIKFTADPDIVFDTYQKSVSVGGQNFTITKLRMTEIGNPSVDLTSDDIDVTNFQLTNVSGASAASVQVNLTLESLNPSQSSSYESQKSWTTTVTLRAR